MLPITANISSRGRIAIPHAIRTRLELVVGDEIDWVIYDARPAIGASALLSRSIARRNIAEGHLSVAGILTYAVSDMPTLMAHEMGYEADEVVENLRRTGNAWIGGATLRDDEEDEPKTPTDLGQTTVMDKWQVTIPIGVRHLLDLKVGDTLIFVQDGGYIYLETPQRLLGSVLGALSDTASTGVIPTYPEMDPEEDDDDEPFANTPITHAAIDTDVLLAVLCSSREALPSRLSDVIHDTATGAVRLFVPPTVWLEVTTILAHASKASRDDIAKCLLAFACLPGVDVEHRPSIESALRYWPLHSGVDFADVYHLALAKDRGITRILTRNPRMNRFAGIFNVDPVQSREP